MPDFDPKQIAAPSGHFIGGRLTPGEPVIDVLRPSDCQPMGGIPDASDDLVDQAVNDAHSSWRASGWGTRSPRERARVLLRWADLIDRHADELARLEAVSSTRPISEARTFDVPFTSDCIRFFAECADKFGGDALPTRQDSLGFVVPEPYGVVAAIAPWNFPLSMASWKCGPALAAGNALVLKPSEMTPFSILRVAELAIEAGVPAGVFNVVQGRGQSAGAALVRHPLIGKVSFTGSTHTGAAIMSNAAQHGTKPVTLELGGKSPQIVFDDAGDIDALAQRILRGFTSNAGQACVSGTRLIVQRGIADRLIDAVIAKAAALEPGPTWRESTRFAPIISEAQATRIDAAVQDSIASGAHALCGGEYFDTAGKGFYYRPTLLAGVDRDSRAVREEIFGPVLTVQTFDDEDEALSLADHPTYGLAAGVHTQDIGRALRAMRRIQAGTVWINRFGRTYDFIIPTGGFKGSGIGKDLGREAFEANFRYKAVLIDF
ncbi:aldehyde dehydrogenase family protein [Paraburkholderia dioscoreae]|uniref:NAD/NADP-dependent betaine aldehyde dehydrogenase n=1 Tax=Paraburkholderia dioscoreae TaxID=2604047 RepID=A0A5Q4ZDG5_9BURK|nr:aldehyde dehydrogenase family protein [Paraburkholderia dioscoreae]VVD33409.1 NAD/NADP-dependent betaine aldehyde dehydrogenase [Paraburkholderia dioscoreae]